MSAREPGGGPGPGSGTGPFELEVSPLWARRFAQAVGDLNPLYFDPAAARAAGFDGCIAPPLYLSSVATWEALPAAGPGREDGVDMGRFPGDLPPDAVLMGGGQRVELRRPVLLGERLQVRFHQAGREVRAGRRGPLTLTTFVGRFTDAAGAEVMVVTDTLLSMDRPEAAP